MVWDSLGNLYKESPQGSLNLLFSRGYQNLFYQSTTLFGREYQTFFNATGGFDIPRQYDDTYWDRVSQTGPGASPSVTDQITTALTIANSPIGLVQSQVTINTGQASQSGPTVTLIASSNFPVGLQVGDTVIVAGIAPAGYNGTFQVAARVGLNGIQYINANLGLALSTGPGTVFTPITQVTMTTAAPPGWGAVGAVLTIASAGVAGYNTTVTVRTAAGGSLTVGVIAQAANLGASGGGTIANSGNIVAGRHNVSCAFITRQGYITQASVPNYWIASGSKAASVALIPTGPSNVLSRLLLFTPVITPPAVSGTFYSLPAGSNQLSSASVMLINDNVTTTAVVDFTDVILQTGFQAEYLFSQLELGECSFVAGYSSRMFWLGERNKLTNFINMEFDGGATAQYASLYPLGWAIDQTFGGGGLINVTADWMDSYQLLGDGMTATRARLFQSAYVDYLGTPILSANTGYSVRVRLLLANSNITQGVFNVQISSASTGVTSTFSVPYNQPGLSKNMYTEFSGVLLANNVFTQGVPADTILSIFANGTPTLLGGFLVDSIEVFPTLQPYNYSTVRASYAFNPEGYDAITGQIQIRPNDGQQLRAAFPIRNNLYFAKDHYLCWVTDDGVNEPASWPVNEASNTIGICGPNAVDWTEEWAVFAERSGCYLCWGADPVKITPEIQEDASKTGKVTWNSINWAYGYTVWVRIDKVNKRILIGAPINSATQPNVVFVLDYKWLDNAQDIAASPMVTYSAFTGKILAHGRGRRWTYWNISANSMTFAERVDGSAQPFFGNNSNNGKIYEQIDAPNQLSDDGAPINSQYWTYFAPSGQEEQELHLSAHVKLFGYYKWRAIGSGQLLMAVQTANRVTNLRNYSLSTAPPADAGRGVNIHGERFSLQIGTDAVGAWFQLEKLIMCVKKDTAIPVRGTNQ
jgi:hypothetical protein